MKRYLSRMNSRLSKFKARAQSEKIPQEDKYRDSSAGRQYVAYEFLSIKV